MSKLIQTVEELDAVLHWRRKHALAIRERDALQQRLTAADERADLLEGLLRDLYLSNSLSVRQMQRVHEIFNPSAAALKPAQVSHAKPETIAGHHLACRAVNDYKPGECSHNCNPAAQPKGVPVPKSKPVAKLHAERLTGRDGEYGITVEDSQWFNTCRLTGGEFYLYAEQPAPGAVVLDEKDEFVTWVRREWPQAPLSNVRDLLPKDDPRYGEYCDEALQRAWVGWQARAAVIAKS